MVTVVPIAMTHALEATDLPMWAASATVGAVMALFVVTTLVALFSKDQARVRTALKIFNKLFGIVDATAAILRRFGGGKGPGPKAK